MPVEGAPAAVICLAPATGTERHAAEEFAKYAQQVLGRVVRLALPGDVHDEAAAVVSVGRTALAESFIVRRLLTLPGDLGEEGFVIQSVRSGRRTHLVLLGGGPAGTLYAVYHYLENHCRVGFFWDGECVPSLATLPMEGLAVVERPRFPVRHHLLCVAYGYSAYAWGWEDWKREIDWAAKHKLNSLSSPPGAAEVWRKVWEDFGVPVAPESLTGPPFLAWASAHLWTLRPPYPEAFQECVADLTKRQADYARSLGMKMDAPWMTGIQVPREFYAACRDRAQFLDVSWSGAPAAKFVHPADPLYVQLLGAFMREYARRYGSDHRWCLPNFAEMALGRDLAPDEQLTLKRDIARRTLSAVLDADAKSVLTCLSWAFYADPAFWPREHVRAFLDCFPDDRLWVWDLWPEFRYPGVAGMGGLEQPLYKHFDYYFGKPWIMAFLHSFAAHTYLHGDLADAIRRVQGVATDPRAARCLGLALNAEVIHHNHLFFDLLCRLAWNPAAVTLEGFLEDYAERRYGRESAPTMARCLHELLTGVYASYDATTPLYQRRLTVNLLRPETRMCANLTLAERARFIPSLTRALEIALDAAEALGADALYQHDLIDIARLLVAELFNVRLLRLYAAFSAGDREAFEAEACAADALLTSQERLLASSAYYRLQPVLEKAMSLPGVPADYDARIRDILTVWAGNAPTRDYARRDYYELVRFYYRKRVEAFVAFLRRRLGKPCAAPLAGVDDATSAGGGIDASRIGLSAASDLEDKGLIAEYEAIEQGWVAGRIPAADRDGCTETPVQAVRGILGRHAAGR